MYTVSNRIVHISTLLVTYLIPMTCAANHSLNYFYTALPQSTGLPEFTAVAYLDEELMYFYDSSTKEVVARQEWVKGAVDPEFWRRNTHILKENEQVFKDNMDTARDRFNQTSALVLQKMYGCDWDEATGATDGHEQYGYGGEDFLLFDLKNERWIAPGRQGLITKMKWDANVIKLEAKIHYLTRTCIEWLKKYVSNRRRKLERTVPPQVTLLQKEHSYPLTCHATGFYPNAIRILWGRDEVEIYDDVVHEETLPNGDGTYQKRIHLTVSPEDLQQHDYTCTVQHVSGDDVVLSANRDSIRSNSRNTQVHYITIVLVLVPLAFSVIGFFIMTKVCKGKEPTAGKEKQCPTSLPEKSVHLLINGSDRTSNRSGTISSGFNCLLTLTTLQKGWKTSF
ncbi:major histocompatibility complex class I-related gene protein isoform X2 [Salmo trutta]|uniref:major histocompatibility complex class I-related gene protein isoform X2 n=1 Tax=Salmo trutta TaxID=8032 RepID=UPI00113044D9|nr:major histocompatibility complex class I-related gene protein-like isoform X2 [Salmo trutta]